MKKKLTIAFFGSSLVSAYWNGAATYYRGIIQALYQRGHRTTFFEPNAFGRQQHRDIADPSWAKVVVYPATLDGMCEAIESARAADVIIKASGVGVLDAELEAAVLELKRDSNRVVFWDVDAPATLDRLINDTRDPLRSLIPQYDLVLTYGGGNPVVEGYKFLGAIACMPIYNAVDPTTHFPVRARQDFISDLSFVGNRLPDREARVDEFFFRAAKLLPELRFLLGGSGWEKKRLTRNIKYIGHVYTADHNWLNCSARSILNVNRESMARYGFSPATRVFEAAGAGACMITDYWEGLEQFLEPGTEVLVARDGEEVSSILSILDVERSQRIGAAACKRVLAEHTYAKRAAQVEEVLQAVA